MGDLAGRVARPLWGAAFALLLALAFPFRAGDVRFDAGLAAGWLALVPFAFLVSDLGPRRAFAQGALWGSLGYAGVLFWVYVVVTVHGHGAGWLGVAAVVLLSGYVGLHAGLAGALVAALRPAAGRAALLVLPAAWVVSEWLRSFDLFGGFPWAWLGYALHDDGPMLELAAYTGVFGLSFLLALFAALLAEGRWRTAVLGLVAAHLLGFVLRVAATLGPPPDAPPLRAGLVQADIPQGQKWDPELAAAHFEAHLELSRRFEADGVDLILWPEASVSVFLENDASARAALAELARRQRAVVLIGGIGLTWLEGEPQPLFHNSVFAIDSEGALVDRYDKSHLVPFGEYVPMRGLLGFLEGVATGMAAGDVTPGLGPRRLRNLELGGDHAPAALICYEVIYPGLVRQAVRDGARVLLNVTNDAWYGRTSAPHQFLAIAAMRSAEHGLPMLRAANTGVSGVIDAGGVVLAQTPIFERIAFDAEVPPARDGPTLYTVLGDWVVWASAALLIGIGGIGVVRRGRRTREGDQGRASGSARASGRAAEASLTSPPSATGSAS